MSVLEVRKTYTVELDVATIPVFTGTVKDNLSYESAIKLDFTLDQTNRIAHGSNVVFSDEDRFYNIVTVTGETIIIAESWITSATLQTGTVSKITIVDLPIPVRDIIKDILSTNSIEYTIV